MTQTKKPTPLQIDEPSQLSNKGRLIQICPGEPQKRSGNSGRFGPLPSSRPGPLRYYQMKQVASSHFRLTNIHTDSIPGQLYTFRLHNLRNLHNNGLESRFTQSCQTIFAGWSITDPLPYPKYLERVMLKNRQKSLSRSLPPPISDIWRKQQWQGISHQIDDPLRALARQSLDRLEQGKGDADLERR